MRGLLRSTVFSQPILARVVLTSPPDMWLVAEPTALAEEEGTLQSLALI